MFNIPQTFLTRGLFYGLLLILGITAFGGLSEHQFDTDDHEWLKEIPTVLQDFSTYFSSNKHTPLRPPVDALFALGYLIWKENAAYFHALQIALHLLISIQFLFVLQRFGIRYEVCLLASLLFFLNVTHFRALHWIFILNHLLATFFVLFFLDSYRRYLYHNTTIFTPLILFFVAIFTHPSVVSVGVFALYLTWHHHRKIAKTLAVSWPLVMAIPLFVLASFLVSPQAPQGRGILTSSPHIGSILTYLFWFLSRLLTNAHWILGGVAEEPKIWELATGVAIVVGTLLLYIRKIFPLANWCIFCVITVLPFIHRSPEWQFLPFGPSRQLYIATLGSSLFFAFAIQHLHRYVTGKSNKNLACWITASIVLALTFSSVYSLQQVEAPSYYTSGRSYIARGNLETGATLIERALRHEATLVPIDAYLRLATASFAQGKSQSEILEEGLKQHPKHPQLTLLLGLSMYLDDKVAQGRHLAQQAFETTEDTEQLRSDAGLALQNLAGYYHKNKDYEKAVTFYKEALLYRPHYPIARFNMANALYKLDRYEEAINTMRQAVELDPSYETAVQFLGNMLFEQERFPEAEEIYHHHLTLDNQNPNIYYNLALAQQKQKKFSQAAKTYHNALALAPDDTQIHLQLAEMLHEAGQSTLAIDEYQNILKNHPIHLKALQTATALLIGQNRTADAVTLIQNALNYNSTNHEIWYLLAQAYQAQNNTGELRKALHNAVKHAPQNEHYLTSYLNLGALFQQRQQPDIARSIYHDLVQISPTMPDVHINLGILEFAQKRYTEAVISFQHATKYAPNDPETHLGLAQAFEKSGKHQQAIQSYRQVLSLDSQNKIAHSRLQILQ